MYVCACDSNWRERKFWSFLVPVRVVVDNLKQATAQMYHNCRCTESVANAIPVLQVARLPGRTS